MTIETSEGEELPFNPKYDKETAKEMYIFYEVEKSKIEEEKVESDESFDR